MKHDEVQKRVETFLQELGVPGFIVFGWQKEDDKENYNIISSFHEMPVRPALKGLSHVLNEFVQKTL